MTPDELKAHGQRLFGHRWQTELAVAFGVNTRTMRRWAKGDSTIPRWVQYEIKELKAAKS